MGYQYIPCHGKALAHDPFQIVLGARNRNIPVVSSNKGLFALCDSVSGYTGFWPRSPASYLSKLLAFFASQYLGPTKRLMLDANWTND